MTREEARELYLKHCKPGYSTLERYGMEAAINAILEAIDSAKVEENDLEVTI